jgi:predicted O-methyltransferase YrrM
MKPLYERYCQPPNNFWNHSNFLNSFASSFQPTRYLELGVSRGETFTLVAQHCGEAIAVEFLDLPFSLPHNAVHEKMTTDEYFSKINQSNIMFDMVFIDADHSFEQSYKDFLNVKDKVVEDGFVFFHDTYPVVSNLIHKDFCDTAYKTPVEIKNNFSNEWELVTLPFNPGLTIARKLPNKQLPWM